MYKFKKKLYLWAYEMAKQWDTWLRLPKYSYVVIGKAVAG